MAYQHAPNLLGKLWDQDTLPFMPASFHHLSGCLSLYLILLSVLCFVSILSTVVHAIPYPNSIVMYNLGTLLICYLIYTYTQGTEGSGGRCECSEVWKPCGVIEKCSCSFTSSKLPCFSSQCPSSPSWWVWLYTVFWSRHYFTGFLVAFLSEKSSLLVKD